MKKGYKPNSQLPTLSPADISERKLSVIARHVPGTQAVPTDAILRRIQNLPRYVALTPTQMAHVLKIIQSEFLCTKYGVRLVQTTEAVGLRLVVIPKSKLEGWLQEARELWALHNEPTQSARSPHFPKGVAGHGKTHGTGKGIR